MSDKPENAGDQQLDGERVQVAQDVPPRMAAAGGIPFDDEKLVVLVLNI